MKGSADDLRNEKLGKLLLSYSLPAIIATSAASLYNITDRIFIGQGVGPLAISGLALTFPLMNITAAFGAMVGVGASAMVSIRLGQHDRRGATQILGNAVMLNIILGISVGLIALIFLEPLLYALGASIDTFPYAREYMQVVLAGTVFTHLYLGMNNIMRASGYPSKAMVTTLITVGVNLILDPFFIFFLGWGIRGAAIATVLSQIAGTITVVVHFVKGKSFVHFLPGYMKLKKLIIGDIISIGMSNFLMLIAGSIVITLINISLGRYGGDLAVGAFGIVYSITNLAAMVVVGLNQGMQPIVGYNYGALKTERVLKAFKMTVFAATAVTSFMFLFAEIFPGMIARAFTKSPDLIGLTVRGMRLNLMVFPIVGFQMVTSSFFQSIGKARFSIFLSLTRQVLFLIPALLILPRFIGLDGVWLGGPVSDFSSSLLTLFVLKWQIGILKKRQFPI
ncbi:MAG: MATE family efflux transporter [Bacteroidetes bacterium]|jgi:putative MATE family efflux protein|nr:MATE family efflux transporter [Bacteroidota bacterium]